mgnify:FL=1
MVSAETIIRAICSDFMPELDERRQRKLAGVMAKAYGYGGTTLVSNEANMSRNTVRKGIDELENPIDTAQLSSNGVRRTGGGRISAVEKNPEIIDEVDRLLQETTYGDSMRVIQYTTLSLRKIADLVSQKLGISISRNIVSRLLEELGYSKQQNQKMNQIGSQHPDRDTQFRHINERGKAYIAAGEPFISIDCKKKENIGEFKNAGAEYRHIGDARRVLDHDFPIKALGKVAPYGIYTVNNNTGFVNLGTSHDTAEFAVQSIRSWWYDVGQHTFPKAKRLLITADGGGSNGSRNRLFKVELAQLAAETGLAIEVAHFPPGTSKWNKVEHRLFCYITSNWEGQPLVSVEVAVHLIGSTTTKAGLKVICKLDERSYPTGIKVSDELLQSVDIEYLSEDSSWNYIIKGFKENQSIS